MRMTARRLLSSGRRVRVRDGREQVKAMREAARSQTLCSSGYRWVGCRVVVKTFVGYSGVPAACCCRQDGLTVELCHGSSADLVFLVRMHVCNPIAVPTNRYYGMVTVTRYLSCPVDPFYSPYQFGAILRQHIILLTLLSCLQFVFW